MSPTLRHESARLMLGVRVLGLGLQYVHPTVFGLWPLAKLDLRIDGVPSDVSYLSVLHAYKV